MPEIHFALGRFHQRIRKYSTNVIVWSDALYIYMEEKKNKYMYIYIFVLFIKIFIQQLLLNFY